MFTVTGGLVGIAALTLLAAAPGAAATAACGSAQVINANAEALGALKLDLSTPKVTYPAGGKDSLASLTLGADPKLAKLSLIDAYSKADHGSLKSESDVVNLDLLGLIHVDVLKADCTSNTNGVTGASDIVGVKIGGKPISKDVLDAKITANNPVPLNSLLTNLLNPLVGNAVTVTFDEHVRAGNVLTVNALHVHIDTAILGLPALAKSDIIVSQAVCSLGEVPGGGTVPTGPTGTPTPTSATPTSTQTTAPTSTSTGGSAPSSTPAVANASDNKNLPFTGVAGIAPMIIGAVVLIAVGTGLFLYTRRRAGRVGGGSDNS
ncbi:MAG TPA: choice-of-anchor P family protein [Pseudonocardiaceae bacterium]|jgi:hypothetical protein|nr:choice-of-anchor P family protein [Pseudonocardiaceae bacterium]